MSLTEAQISSLLTWIDEIPLSRPKRNITRDFSDGGSCFKFFKVKFPDLNVCFCVLLPTIVACAEVIHHFFPKLVEMHMYSPANSVSQKMSNWNTLNRKRNTILYCYKKVTKQTCIIYKTTEKVFRKIGYSCSQDIISKIVENKPGYIEYLLHDIRPKVRKRSKNETPRLYMDTRNYAD
jgi:hypothetical protein